MSLEAIVLSPVTQSTVFRSIIHHDSHAKVRAQLQGDVDNGVVKKTPEILE